MREREREREREKCPRKLIDLDSRPFLFQLTDHIDGDITLGNEKLTQTQREIILLRNGIQIQTQRDSITIMKLNTSTKPQKWGHHIHTA